MKTAHHSLSGMVRRKVPVLLVVLAGILPALLLPSSALSGEAPGNIATLRSDAPSSLGTGEEPGRKGPRRKPPRLPVHLPHQVSFSSEPVLSAAVSPDGERLVYAFGSRGTVRLRMISADPAKVILPRTLTPEGENAFSPVFSPDGRRIAYVSTRRDARGDLFLLDLDSPHAAPRRLTGKNTGDAAPCFSPGGDRIYFHLFRPGDPTPRIAVLDLSRKDARPRLLDLKGDGAFPALSPDGRYCAFVSTRNDPGGDIFVADLRTGSVIPLTHGPARDGFPQWSPDGRYVYFSRIGMDTDGDGAVTESDNAVVYRIRPQRPGAIPFPVTSALYSCYRPIPISRRLYFLSNRKDTTNVWATPPSGEIPCLDTCAKQMELARSVEGRIPLDTDLAVLAYFRVLERFSGRTPCAAEAAQAIGKLYLAAGRLKPAEEAFGLLLRLFAGVQPQAGLAEIYRTAIQTRLAWPSLPPDRRKKRLQVTLTTLEAIASRYKEIPRIAGRSRIEQARLLMDLGKDADSLARALGFLEKAAKSSPTRAQTAEAMVLRAELYGKMGRGEATIPAYIQVIRTFPDIEPWSDTAINRVLDLLSAQAPAGEGRERIQLLLRTAERYETTLPKLAMGAWNRIGDLYFARNEWSQAKEAYRTALERFPYRTTQTAAARLALAEILYREERFHQALDLYETEWAGRPYEDRIYRLARHAYVQKSLGAAEHLFRTGEIASARSIFEGLLREDPDLIEAHRGRVKCAAAQNETNTILGTYRKRLEKDPDNPTLLYAVGLCLTYREDKDSLHKARTLIRRAIELRGQVEYFHQTLGYIQEILETVYGEQGELEHALESYKKAYFLNDPETNPRNAANLLLNLGNVYYLLGQYGSAFDAYAKRRASRVPFDRTETEILFYKRFGSAAFQTRRLDRSVEAYRKALELLDKSIRPKKASEWFGRIHRRIMDRILAPALKRNPPPPHAGKWAEQQSDLSSRVFEISRRPVAWPPDPSWTAYSSAMKRVLSEETRLAARLIRLLPDHRHEELRALSGMIRQAEHALALPPRMVQLKAELLDRLGLAYQEAGQWHEAREAFERTYALNKRMGLLGNLAKNRRSAAFNTYMEAGTRSGEARERLLRTALEGFESVIRLVRRYGVAQREEKAARDTSFLSFRVSLDQRAATRALYGFSPQQEKHIAEAFIARIRIELGELEPAERALEAELARYPEDKPVRDEDLYGVSLLCHRAAQVAYARRHLSRAFARFRRSARLCLELKSPVSTAVNVLDMARVLAEMDPDSPRTAAYLRQLTSLDRAASRLLDTFEDVLAPQKVAAYHNSMGVLTFALWSRGSSGDPVGRAVRRMKGIETAGAHFSRALDRMNRGARWESRETLALRAALHLNLAYLARALGETGQAEKEFEAALNAARKGLLPDYEWRILAGMGRYEEALHALESTSIARAHCGPNEVIRLFTPWILDRMQSGEAEDAFNLLERISELQRVQETVPFLFASLSSGDRALLRKAYPRLLVIRKLKRRLASAKWETRTYLSERLKTEEKLLAGIVGKKGERMPRAIRMCESSRIREWVTILLGAALDAEETVHAAWGAGSREGIPPEVSKQYLADLARYRRLFDQAIDEAPAGEPLGMLGFLGPRPAEAIDVMESLPADGMAVRLLALPDPRKGWAGFVLDRDGIRTDRWGPELHLDTGEADPVILICEDPGRLPARLSYPVALSGTHLFRCVQNKKPFREKVLQVGSAYSLEAPFQVQSLPLSIDAVDFLDRLPYVHTLLFDPPARTASPVPTRPGETLRIRPALELARGRALSLLRVGTRLSNVSLVVLPQGAWRDVYTLGHLCSLYGVSTVLMPRSPRTASAFVPSFFKHYARLSAAGAFREARSGLPEGSLWIQIGYWGMDVQKSRVFARKRFVRTIRRAVRAYRDKQYTTALSSFEAALGVARQIPAFHPYLPDLYRFARESAFSLGRMDTALQYARELAGHMEKTDPHSKAHAQALLKLGLLQARAERYDRAIRTLKKAVDLLADLDLDEERLTALTQFGIVLENATEYDRALERFQSAALLSRTLKKTDLLARQYIRIGRIYDLRLNEYARARQSYRQAFDIYRASNRPLEAAQALLDLGRCARLLGNFPEAHDCYEQAMALLEHVPGSARVKAKIRMEQANNAWFQGRYQKAFDLDQRVLKEARARQWKLEQVLALNTSGLIWWTLGDYDRALRDLGQALDLARTLRIRRDEVATSLNNLGMVYREKGEYDKALEFLDRALAIDREIRSRWAVAYDLRNKAMTRVRMGSPETAIPLFKEALRLSREIGNRINQAKILVGLGNALADLHRREKARRAFQEALRLSRSMILRETEWRALYGLSLLLLEEGRKEEARDRLTEAVDVIEKVRAGIKLDQLKDGFVTNKLSVYETLVSLLADLGEPERAFDVAERSRARNLIDLLGRQRLNLRGAVERSLYERQKTLKARIREQEALLAQSRDAAERAAYRQALVRLNDRFRDLMLEIQARNPELATLVSVQPLSLAAVQKLLDREVVLLAFYLVPRQVLCWVIGPDSFHLLRTPVDRKALGSLILEYRRRIQNLEPLQKESTRLYHLLMKAAIPHLHGVRYVGIVPYGPLHYLSFATLNSGEGYLADRYAFFYLPSASVFRYTLARRGARKNTRVLAIGNPDLGNPAWKLPFAEYEVETIHWNFPDITLLTGKRATESWVVQHIGEFGIIHIASHGEFNPINPLFSAVKLVPDLHSDGDLEALEVFGLRLHADLVVLSACQTGLGSVTSGDDVIGLNRSFLYAGTHAIISSLWRVSDISTAILVKQFYREYVYKNKAESLRRAMLHVKRRYPHPGYWGAFVLSGDYE